MLRYWLTVLLSVLLLACGEDSAVKTTEPASGDPAITELSNLIAAQPAQAELYAQRAQLYYERENYVDAAEDFSRATELDPTTLSYPFALADVYLDDGQPEEAIRVLDGVAKRTADTEALLRLAEAELIAERYLDASANLTIARGLDPENPEVYYLLSQVQEELGYPAEAIATAQEAIRLDPDMIDAHLLVALLYAEQDDPRALDYYDAAVSLDSLDVVARHGRADYFYQQGQLDRALTEYRQLNMVDRQYVAANYNAGLILLELDSLQQAYNEFNIVVRNDPGSIEAYLQRGLVSELLGEEAAARWDYETALRMNPNFSPAQEALARLNG